MGFSYKGSKGWLVFWAIFGFPVALILLILNLRLEKGE